jgi:hypothetical protein
MAGEVEDLLGELERHGEAGVAGVESLGRGQPHQAHLVPRAPAALGQPGGHVLAQAHGLADLADGAAGTVTDDSGADGGPLAAITVIEVLDHLLAPLMLAVDVDVRRLTPAVRHASLSRRPSPPRISGPTPRH